MIAFRAIMCIFCTIWVLGGIWWNIKNKAQ